MTEPHLRRALFTTHTLAEYLALSERTVRELLRAGEIPSYKIGGARRIDPDDVDRFLEKRRTATRAT
ncbi:MAG: helix-turn-helix domain-containing protein [Thermoleophilaceae bacterium]